MFGQTIEAVLLENWLEIYWTKQLNCFFADGQKYLCSTDSTGSPGSSSHHRALRLVPGMFQLWAFKYEVLVKLWRDRHFLFSYGEDHQISPGFFVLWGPVQKGVFSCNSRASDRSPPHDPMDPSGSPRSRWIWPYLTRQQQVLPHVQVGIPGLELGHGDRTTCDMGIWQNVVKKC